MTLGTIFYVHVVVCLQSWYVICVYVHVPHICSYVHMFQNTQHETFKVPIQINDSKMRE